MTTFWQCVTKSELSNQIAAVEKAMKDYIASVISVLYARHTSTLNRVIQLEKTIMTMVQIDQAQIDSLHASAIKVQDAATAVGADRDALVALIKGLRDKLATALAAEQPLPVADISDTIAGIDAVTSTLSQVDSDEQAAIPDTPPAGTPVTAPSSSPPPDGVTPPAPATPAPAAPNAGDPTGQSGLDHSDPVNSGDGNLDPVSGSTGG